MLAKLLDKERKKERKILLCYLFTTAVRFLKNLLEIYCSLCPPESICLCQPHVMDSWQLKRTQQVEISIHKGQKNGYFGKRLEIDKTILKSVFSLQLVYKQFP